MKRAFALILVLMLTLSGCAMTGIPSREQDNFEMGTVYSHSKQYYATPRVENIKHDDGYYMRLTYVDIYQTETGELLSSFSASLERDYLGICWETDTNCIWVHSADTGYWCYKYSSGEWVLDESRITPPADIVPRD